MANLGVEKLNQVTQAGDIGAMFGPGGGSPIGPSSPSAPSAMDELRATREMQAQGMQAPRPGESGRSFAEIMNQSVEQVNQMQVEANDAIHELIAGRTKNIHETMLTIERADTSLKLMMQVRNKVLDAYREIMRMQV